LPLSNRYVLGPTTGQNSDVVHDHIDPTEELDRNSLDLLEGGIGSDVADHAGRTSTGPVDLSGNQFTPGAVDVRHDDPGSAARQRERGRSSDAAGPAGDDRGGFIQ
jgi:hypothetical protein